jgi:hypothetical protein
MRMGDLSHAVTALIREREPVHALTKAGCVQEPNIISIHLFCCLPYDSPQPLPKTVPIKM